MEVGGQLHAPAALPAMERAPHPHWIGGLVGSQSHSRRHGEEKDLLSLLRIEPRMSSP
jgi:hypothetical protein